MKQHAQAGEANPLLIANIVTGILVVILAGVSIWAFIQYNDQKNNTTEKINSAVKKAQSEQIATDEKRFLEQEKLPTRKFAGPAELGSLVFQYPKTWSAYNAKVSGGYETYFYPDVVPLISTTQPYALRVQISEQDYDQVIKSYDSLVKKGDLRSSQATVQGFSGIRLDGKFTKEREGSAVLFKLRDKTLILATDSSVFKNDFDSTILTSLKFNP